MANWGVAEAKARFSAVVEQALSEGPPEITRNGKQVVTVIATEELERLRKSKHVGGVPAQFSLARVGLEDSKRNRWKARPVKF